MKHDNDMHVRGRWLAHAAWFACAAIAFVILLAAIPLGYAPYVGRATVAYVAVLYVVSAGVSLLIAFGSIVFSAVLFWKRRDEPMALFISFYLLTYAVFVAGPVEALNGFTSLIYSDLLSQIGRIFFVLPILFLYLFPNGRFVPPWTRWAALLLLLILPAFALTDVDLYILTNPRLYLTIVVISFFVGAGIFAQIYRFRHAATPVERQQIKWVAFGLSFYLSFVTVSSIPYLLLLSMPTGNGLSTSPWDPVGDAMWWLLMGILPLSLAIAVMRYRLWDIDIIINRALVYGTLTAGTIALYVILVGVLSEFSQTSGNILISLLAAGLIAFLFQPLRERLQRGVNHLIYGERDDPYQVLSRLGQRLESTLAPDAVLSTIVETVAQALKLPYAAIELGSDGQRMLRAEYPHNSSFMAQQSELAQFPLTYHHETVGMLFLAPRAPGESFSPADLRLLGDFTRQAGIAAHAAQLTYALQRSREQLVVAREEERRRIRRDLHDGLGPALASLAMQADGARELTCTDPDRAEAAMAEVALKAQDALQDVRRLVYGLRPPALDELGLVGALKQTAASAPNGLHIDIDAPEPLPALPAAVEVATYRIAQETLNNVARHSQARNCIIVISVLDELRLEIRDDGVGLPPDVHAGVGLTSMRERATELGGSCVIESTQGKGTRVLARMPLMQKQSEDG